MSRALGSETGKRALVADGKVPLLTLIASHVDKHLLEQIAAANNSVEQTRHLLALLKIWKAGTVATPLQKYPRDVLDIVRGGKLGGLARAFSCAVLLSDACTSDDGAIADLVAQLILSLKDLPFNADDEAQELLEALPAANMVAAERVLLGSGTLWFALRNNAPVVSDIMDRIARVTREHFDAMSAHWGLVTDELALPDMTVVDVDRTAWLHIAELMCDIDLGQLDRSLAGKVGVHLEMLRRALA
jgi:hypothetical protein